MAERREAWQGGVLEGYALGWEQRGKAERERGASRMTPAQWRLSRRVLEVLAAEVGMTDRMLAEHLSVTVAELRPVVGMLVGRGRLEPCGDYHMLGPQAAGPTNGAAA